MVSNTPPATISQAIFQRDAEAVERFASSGASVDAVPAAEHGASVGRSARRRPLSLFGLMIEACRIDMKCAKVLIRHGANPSGCAGEEPPLARVFSEMRLGQQFGNLSLAQKAEIGFARYLLDQGANPNVVDWSDATPLMRCVQGGDLALALELLAAGADPDFVNAAGVSALGLACRDSRVPMVKLLLERGSRQFWKDTGPNSVLSMAKTRGGTHNLYFSSSASQISPAAAEVFNLLSVAQELHEIEAATAQPASSASASAPRSARL